MKKNSILTGLFLLIGSLFFAQVGINTTTPDPSAVLDVVSTNKGLLLPRVANTAALTGPIADGLLVYDLSSSCFRGYQNGAWSACLGSNADAATNGTATVTSYVSKSSTGTMNVGVAVSGVTQTITATVATAGTYSISASANGVIFSAFGTFAGTGAQDIILTASGTPRVVGTHRFNLNTIPSCSFDRITDGCPVKISATTSKNFQCFNLGADTTLDPHTPVQGIHGNYYQWGRSTPVANASTPSGPIAGWNSTPAADGSWAEGSKTAADPCPTGYRVPTNSEWSGVLANNVRSQTGTFTGSDTNFDSAYHFGPDASTHSLTLPTAGYRYPNDGRLVGRNTLAEYWSVSSGGVPAFLQIYSGGANAGAIGSNSYGFSLRCIAE